MKSALLTLAIALALSIIAAVPTLAQSEDVVKITVIQQTKFSNLSYYMIDTAQNKLVTLDTSKAQVLDYQLKDLVSNDAYMPAVVLTLDAPTKDLNTNETVVYAWVLTSSYGSAIIVGVADVGAGNALINLNFYKISPVSGDVAIVRTNADISIQYSNTKLSIPLSGYSSPKVILYTDGELLVNGVNYIQLRALANPPAGYTLIRSGTGEAVFTISASGTLSVWFDESHDPGDVDLFIFDQSNSYYSQADVSQSWSWLVSYATRYVFADAAPQTVSFTATGNVKFVVKSYYNGGSVSWRVAASLSGGSTPQPQPTQTQPTQTITQTQVQIIREIQTAFSNSTVIYVVLGLLFLIVLIVVLRK